MRFHLRRGGELVGLIVFSCWCVGVFFPTVGARLRQTALGERIWSPHYWKWGEERRRGGGGGLRLVVFGDSWVDDTVQDGEDGKGRSWPAVLCDQIECNSHYNFAASQPSTSFPKQPQTGALTLNSRPQFASTSDVVKSLPDFSTQIRQFLILLDASSPTPTETIFVVSFGFWDVYHLAGGLDFEASKKAVDDTINELLRQLDILYAAYSTHVFRSLSESQGASSSTTSTTSTSTSTTTPDTSAEPSFRVVIPKLVDPTLLPGWMARPAPLPPASVAEEQRHAVYLTERWNAVLESRVGEWMDSAGDDSPPPPSRGQGNQTESETTSRGKEEVLSPAVMVKDVFYYDLSMNLVSMLIEHQLDMEDMAGATEIKTSFESVRVPCMRDQEENGKEDFIEVSGKLVCSNPENYLFWDGFRIGAVASKGIGEAVGQMVNEGVSLRKLLGEETPRGDL